MSNDNNRGRFTKDDPRAKQFQKGQSGNPGGRPKGFGPLIRHETRNGEELVEFVLLVFRKGSLKNRMWAVDWLADRGYGKPVQISTLRREDVVTFCQNLGEMALATVGQEAYDKLLEVWGTLDIEWMGTQWDHRKKGPDGGR